MIEEEEKKIQFKMTSAKEYGKTLHQKIKLSPTLREHSSSSVFIAPNKEKSLSYCFSDKN